MTWPVAGLMVGKVLPDVLLTHWPLMRSLVALILTLGSIAVVAVAMKPPNCGSRQRWGAERYPLLKIRWARTDAERTSYTPGMNGTRVRSDGCTFGWYVRMEKRKAESRKQKAESRKQVPRFARD